MFFFKIPSYRLIYLAVFFFLINSIVYAHAIDPGRIGLDITDEKMVLVISFGHDALIKFDDDQDEHISFSEIQKNNDVIMDFINGNFYPEFTDEGIAITSESLMVIDEVPILYRVYSYQTKPEIIDLITKSGIWRTVVESGKDRRAFLIDDDNRRVQVNFSQSEAIKSSFWQGAKRIMFGYEHLFFLIGLLLFGSVLSRIITVLILVVSSMLGLHLGLQGIMGLPNNLIPLFTSLSICIVSIQAFRPQPKYKIKKILTFGGFFGLLYGLAFASFLGENLEKTEHQLSWLFGFNTGILTGQLIYALLISAVILVIQKKTTGVKITKLIGSSLFVIGILLTVYQGYQSLEL